MITPDNTLALLAVLCAIAAAAAALEKTRVGGLFAAPGMIIAFAIILSQLGVLPKAAPLYDAIWTYLVPMAVALFLFKANLLSVFREGGRVLAAFAIGMVGVIVGALLGAAVLDLGPEGAGLAALFTATYTGGSLNFAAVAEAIDLKDASLLTTALTIDNVLGAGYIFLINVMGGWAFLRHRYAWRLNVLASDTPRGAGSADKPLTVIDLLVALAIAAAVCSFSAYVAALLAIPGYSMLFITVASVAIATVGASRIGRIRGEDVVALAFMYLFFAMIGAGVDIGAMLNAAPSIFILVLMIFAFHLLFLFVGGWMLKLNYAELLTASLACIAGPPVAAAVAILFKWRNLVVPGVLTGIFGYVAGNFLGLGVYAFLGGGQ